MLVSLSKHHGLNPSVDLCFFCNEPKGVALVGAMSKRKREAMFGPELAKEAEYNDVDNDAAAPRAVVYGMEPCSKCRSLMEKGVILISVDEEKSKEDTSNPYRTGCWACVSEEFIRAVVTPPELMKRLLKQRVAFVPDEAWDALELPRGDQTLPVGFTPAVIKVMAQEHMKLFEKRIASGSRHIRVDECKKYLELWTGIDRKGGKGFTLAEKQEIDEAIQTGDYNKYRDLPKCNIVLCTTGESDPPKEVHCQNDGEIEADGERYVCLTCAAVINKLGLLTLKGKGVFTRMKADKKRKDRT